MDIKKGDIVGRKSYNKDIIFIIEKIVKNKNIAILKGLNLRIQADSDLEDLELIDNHIIMQNEAELNERFESRIRQNRQYKKAVYTGKILHLDGDRRYSEKSSMFYRKLGLKAIVKNISEKRQPYVIEGLVSRYNPDIVVITGHDGMIKKQKSFNDINNYRNSKYFIESVKRVKLLKNVKKELVIFAGACQSYYEELITAGANFASSPARILIDFIDPLIVAERIATTEENKFIGIKDIENELRDGQRGINGIGTYGKKKYLKYL